MNLLFFDKSFKLARANFFQKCLQFFGLSIYLKLNASIGKVANPACNFKSPSQFFRLISEADSLHSAFVENLFCVHGMKIICKVVECIRLDTKRELRIENEPRRGEKSVGAIVWKRLLIV